MCTCVYQLFIISLIFTPFSIAGLLPAFANRAAVSSLEPIIAIPLVMILTLTLNFCLQPSLSS